MRGPTNSYEGGAIVGVRPTCFAVLVPDYPLTIWVLVPTEDPTRHQRPQKHPSAIEVAGGLGGLARRLAYVPEMLPAARTH